MKRERTPVRLFVIAAAADAADQGVLEKHVYPLWQQRLLENWQSRQPGEEAEDAFSEAKLILLLLSADYNADASCQQQMQRALERERQGTVKVLAILLRPVEMTNAPFLHLPMVPTNGQAVVLWGNQDAAWTHITEGIRCVLEGKPLPQVGEAKEAASVPAAEKRAQSLEQVTKSAVSVSGNATTYNIDGDQHTHYHYSSPRSPVSPPAAEKRVWMVPYARNPFFTGRDEVLEDLHQRFQKRQAQAVSQPQAMSGLGGIGKTQLAVEYAYRYHEAYQQVLWASAETAEFLNTAYTQIATKLDLAEKGAQEQEVIVEAVKQWLAEHEGWLLILDNADELELLEAFLPSAMGGQVVVTTRASDLTSLGLGFGHALEVETFTPEQGALFLLHRAGVLALDALLNQAKAEDRQQAMELSEELGGLPLALDQAGAYMAQTQCTVARYQQLYQTHRRQLLKERRGKKEHPDPVATTWKLSFERVEATNAAAAELLRLCSFLAPNAIPEWMLVKGAEQVGPLLAPVVADEYRLDQAVETLRAYSLLRRDAQAGMLSVHRLVQVVLRDAMEEEEETAWKEGVLRLLEAVCADVSKFEEWPRCEQWVSHVLVSVKWLEEVVLQTEGEAWVCNQAGYYLHARGRYQAAEPLYRRALEIREQELGPGHPSTATNLNNLAALYYAQGKYGEAEPLVKRALEILEQSLGGGHPTTKIGRSNYAALLRILGREEEAAALEGEGD